MARCVDSLLAFGALLRPRHRELNRHAAAAAGRGGDGGIGGADRAAGPPKGAKVYWLVFEKCNKVPPLLARGMKVSDLTKALAIDPRNVRAVREKAARIGAKLRSCWS